MTEMYRLKFKSEAFEVELEGPDETIIGSKLSHLISISQKASPSAVIGGFAPVDPINELEEDEFQLIDGRVDPKRIAEIIHSSKRIKAIQNKILNKSNQLFRILLSLHYATSVYGQRGYSTGLLEEITAALGKRLRKSNIAAQIKLNQEYFVADRDPGKGVTALYLLTDEGRDALEDKLNS